MKHCTVCSMPDTDGAFWIVTGTVDELWCGACLRNKVERLRKGNEHANATIEQMAKMARVTVPRP